MSSKVTSLQAAVGLVPDGSRLGAGGILTTRRPVALLHAIGGGGRRDLRLVSMLAGLDAELLAAHGALASLDAIYVGFEALGPAPALEAAVAAGTVRVREHSELTLLGGLRAALAGLPFMPTRGATGSDVATGLGLEEIADPYTGERLLAAPAIRPDVCVLHAEAATMEGTVLGPADRDFLFDYDANLARASATVVVGVERLADDAELRERRRDVLLHAHEVDAIVLLPGGAAPSAMPGVHGVAVDRIGAYLTAARDGDPRAALDVLVAR